MYRDSIEAINSRTKIDDPNNDKEWAENIPIGQHSLRHTFATRCIESGVPAVVLKTWLGHTDIHITLDTYTDVFEQLDQSAVNTLDDYLEAI